MAEKPANRSGSPDMSWRGPGFAARTSQKSTGRGWTIFLFGSLLALVSLLIVWFNYIGPVPKEAVYLSINIGQYNDRQFPVVRLARRGRERVKRHSTEESRREPQTKELGLLKKELEGLASRPADQALIVHITALALVHNGE